MALKAKTHTRWEHELSDNERRSVESKIGGQRLIFFSENRDTGLRMAWARNVFRQLGVAPPKSMRKYLRHLSIPYPHMWTQSTPDGRPGKILLSVDAVFFLDSLIGRLGGKPKEWPARYTD